MRAARMHAHGGPGVLRVEEVPVPAPGPGELLVRVRATSVNHRDLWIRRGHPHPAYHVDLPAVLGIDVCGEVEATGPGVTRFRPGDRVTANPHIACLACDNCRCGRIQYCTGGRVYRGTYAQYAVVPERIALTVAPTVPDEHVACFPNTYVTAWQMLVGKAGVGPGDVVFVWAGTSGLGSAAVEIAGLAGAAVIATAGDDRKLEVLAERGPDLVLDHRDPDLVAHVLEFTGGRGATIVFEHVGQATWQRSLDLCAAGGTVVSAGATSGDAAATDITAMFAKQLRILGSRVGTLDDALAAVRHLETGAFQPLIDRVVGLDEIVAAHEALESGTVTGKIVVTLD